MSVDLRTLFWGWSKAAYSKLMRVPSPWRVPNKQGSMSFKTLKLQLWYFKVRGHKTSFFESCEPFKTKKSKGRNFYPISRFLSIDLLVLKGKTLILLDLLHFIPDCTRFSPTGQEVKFNFLPWNGSKFKCGWSTLRHSFYSRANGHIFWFLQ